MCTCGVQILALRVKDVVISCIRSSIKALCTLTTSAAKRRSEKARISHVYSCNDRSCDLSEVIHFSPFAWKARLHSHQLFVGVVLVKCCVQYTLGFNQNVLCRLNYVSKTTPNLTTAIRVEVLFVI